MWVTQKVDSVIENALEVICCLCSRICQEARLFESLLERIDEIAAKGRHFYAGCTESIPDNEGTQLQMKKPKSPRYKKAISYGILQKIKAIWWRTPPTCENPERYRSELLARGQSSPFSLSAKGTNTKTGSAYLYVIEYLCTECERLQWSGDEEEMAQHRRWLHWICPQACDNSVHHNEGELMSHMGKCHNLHACNMCEEYFETKKELTNHKKAHGRK